ncbi:MAG: molybdopterin-binding protein [Chloroflexota bacterium]
MSEPRRLETAELLAVGAELLVGETRDTNSGDLAIELTALGVEVRRLSALPDRLEDVTGALRDALSRADLVITTGGLGPTPDDLTRESIAAVCGETPAIDPEQEAWLKGLFERRGVRYSEANAKQAWLIPSATALPNGQGTAPGWWVDRPDGKVIIALPGPPRELRAMWAGAVLPRLRDRGLGADRVAETLRLTGIGESILVDVIGEETLRRRNPEVATYARVDAVDVRISATGDGSRTARELVDGAIADLMPRLEPYVFARGDETWPDAIAKRLGKRTLAIVEIGSAGQLGALLGPRPWLRFAEQVSSRSPLVRSQRGVRGWATHVRELSGADIGLAVVARERKGDMPVDIAVSTAERTTVVHRLAFLGGDQGRRRAANLACAELWTRLGPPAAGRR